MTKKKGETGTSGVGSESVAKGVRPRPDSQGKKGAQTRGDSISSLVPQRTRLPRSMFHRSSFPSLDSSN